MAKKETKPRAKRTVSKVKVKTVEELSNLIKSKKTILIASIKNLPASQFQIICKKLRGKAIVKVPKKSLTIRAIDSSNEDVKKLKEQVREDIAILFSDLDCFELAAELVDSKSAIKAKAGQIAEEDIEIQAGPTDLIPGPAVGELGALGIQIQIEGGKITIRVPKVIAKKGEKISHGAVDVMNKLDIKPFKVGFEPLAAYDSVEKKIYLDIKIDREGTLNELKSVYGKALAFAVSRAYTSNETISFLIGKASIQEKAIMKLMGGESEINTQSDKTVEEEFK